MARLTEEDIRRIVQEELNLRKIKLETSAKKIKERVETYADDYVDDACTTRLQGRTEASLQDLREEATRLVNVLKNNYTEETLNKYIEGAISNYFRGSLDKMENTLLVELARKVMDMEKPQKPVAQTFDREDAE